MAGGHRGGWLRATCTRRGYSLRGTVDFDPGAGTSNLTSFGGHRDAFVSKLDSAGNFVYARQLGGTGLIDGEGIAVDGAGNVYTTGSFPARRISTPARGPVT